MGYFKKTKGSIASDYFKLLQPLGQYGSGIALDVALFDDHLKIKPPLSKNEPITLRYSKITDVFYGIESEITKKNKSVIGRAAVGGLLFGGAGAVVGAVSGAGIKDAKEYYTLFVISYTDKDGQPAFLQFEDTRHYHGKKVSKKLMELCNITKPDKTITEL